MHFAFLADGLLPSDQPLPPEEVGMQLVYMFLCLIGLLVLAYFSVWFLKRLFQNRIARGNATQSIKILEKRMLSPKSVLYLVEVEGRKVLLAESHLEIQHLKSWVEESPPTE
jgi:flagellar protein FliO/FliZ